MNGTSENLVRLRSNSSDTHKELTRTRHPVALVDHYRPILARTIPIMLSSSATRMR